MSLLGYYYYNSQELEANWTFAHELLRSSCELGESEVNMSSHIAALYLEGCWPCAQVVTPGVYQCWSYGAQWPWATGSISTCSTSLVS